jgi:ribosomal-protein-alanine N-acetyltransferase
MTVPTRATPIVRLRPVEWTDIEALAALELELFPHEAWTVESWWAELAERPRRDYVVALDEADGILGYAGRDLAGDIADVMTIATAPAAQGRGIGRLLLDELIARATRHGAEAVLLEVRADNTRARDLYERNGFELLSTRRRYYQPGDVDALVMRRLTKGEDRG